MFVFIPGVQRARASLWIPKPGDNLAVTLSKVYGLSMAHREMAWLVQLHLALNKDLVTAYQPLNHRAIVLADLQVSRGFNPTPEQLKILSAMLQQDGMRLEGAKFNLTKVVPRELAETEAMRVMAGFNDVVSGVLDTGKNSAGVAGGVVANAAGRDISGKLRRFGELAAWHAESLKQGHTARANLPGALYKAAQDIKASISPLERFVFKGGVEEALFSPATKGVQGEWINTAAASKLSKIARAGAVGQVLLLGLEVGQACHDVSVAQREDKVRVAYEKIGGIVGGLISGGAISLGVVAMATPFGWTAALVLGTAMSMGAGKLGEMGISGAYKYGGDFLYLDESRLINRVCR